MTQAAQGQRVSVRPMARVDPHNWFRDLCTKTCKAAMGRE